MVLELRPAHDPIGLRLRLRRICLKDLSASIWLWIARRTSANNGGGKWAIRKS